MDADETVSLLDDNRQITNRTKFHDEVNIFISFLAVGQGHNMGVVQFFEDVDFRFEIVEELSI